MAGASFEPWLETLVTTELSAVILWKNNRKIHPNIKEDPDSRFSDDGSNFRSTVILPAHERGIVQIQEVLSTDGHVIVLLSDGRTVVKAYLSEDAVRSFEVGVGETLNTSMVGDVLRLKQFTVTSTPYGLPDEFIQLFVEDLDYQYHLRRLLGKPVPVGDHEDIKMLLEEVTTFRLQQLQAEDDLPDALPAVSQEDLDPVSGLNDDRDVKQLYVDNDELSEANTPSRKPENTTLSRRETSRFASQFASHSQAGSPSLNGEGFEIISGVNLDRPMRANATGTITKIARAAAHQPLAGRQPLLDLLNSKSSRHSTADETRIHEPRIDVTTHSENVEDQTAVGTQALSESAAQESPSIPSIRRNTEGSVDTETSNGLVLPTPGPNASNKLHVTKYGRKRVPPDQQALLDHSSSWVPSLPGKQFPHPNVPIELLKSWNDEALRQVEKAVEPAVETLVLTKPSVESDQTPDESSDEEIPSSHWPSSSPLPQKPQMPPDSSYEDFLKHKTPPKVVESSPPKTLPIRKSPSGVHPDVEQTPGKGNLDKVVGIAQIRSSGYRLSPSEEHDISRSAQRTPTSRTVRSPTSISHPQLLDLGPVPLPLQKPATSSSARLPSLQHDANVSEQTLPSTRPDSVTANTTRLPVKTLAVEDTPIHSKQDPAELHFQKKHEFFKVARQRRDWLKETYIPDRMFKIHIATVLAMYRLAHYTDTTANEDTILRAAKDTFPGFHITPNSTFRRRTNPPGWQSSPSQMTQTPSVPQPAPSSMPAPSSRAPASSNRPPTSGQRSPPSADSPHTGRMEHITRTSGTERAKHDQKGSQDTNGTKHAEASGFEDFYHRYRKLKMVQNEQREARDRIDVLAWNF